MTERVLNAFGITICGDLLTHRGLLAAMFSALSTDFFFSAALALGTTRHSSRPSQEEPHRKGISCERTFRAMSLRADLEAMVS